MNARAVQLGDLIDISKGKKASHVFERPTKTSRRYLQIDDLRPDAKPKFVEPFNCPEASKSDVVIAWDGANAGTVSYNLDGYIGSTLAVLRPTNGKIFAPYLARFLEGNFSFLQALSTGATVPHLDREVLEQLEIPLPDLSEQKRIAGLLEQADQLRRTRHYALELSDTFLPAAFLELFGDPVGNPKRWEKRPLGEISGIRRGASPRPIEQFLGGTVPWIKIGDGTKGDQNYISATEDHVTQEGAAKSVFLKRGALIFANCGVSCGFARILKIDGCIHDGWLAFSDFESALDPIFFLQAINQITLHLRSLAPEGTQPNLNTGIMGKFPMILPPMELQQHFAGLVARHESSRAGQREALRQADHLFQSLLHEAFAGP